MLLKNRKNMQISEKIFNELVKGHTFFTRIFIIDEVD